MEEEKEKKMDEKKVFGGLIADCFGDERAFKTNMGHVVNYFYRFIKRGEMDAIKYIGLSVFPSFPLERLVEFMITLLIEAISSNEYGIERQLQDNRSDKRIKLDKNQPPPPIVEQTEEGEINDNDTVPFEANKLTFDNSEIRRRVIQGLDIMFTTSILNKISQSTDQYERFKYLSIVSLMICYRLSPEQLKGYNKSKIQSYLRREMMVCFFSSVFEIVHFRQDEALFSRDGYIVCEDPLKVSFF